MYRNQLIFTPIHGKGQQFVAPKDNGDTLSHFAIANIGYISGNKRQIDAIMTDLVAEGDKWKVYNIVNADNIYIKSVAVLGVSNVDKGCYLALRYFGEVEGVGIKANWIGDVSYLGLKRFLDHDQSTYTDRITSSDLEQFEKLITSETAAWSDEKLISHGKNVSHLLFDMLQNDDEGLLLDSMDRSEFAAYANQLQDETDDLYLIDSSQLDALITPYGRIDILIQRLSQAIGRVGNNKVNVTSITPTKPFKRNSVVNVAVLLEFADGQTISIIFHNPDATPSTLANADVLTSWKWLLNKRDVSVVLQPQNGENVNLAQLAVRMMQLVNKNSARFKRTQVKRSENEQKLKALLGEEESKLNQLQSLDADIAALQIQIDEANNTNSTAEQSAAEQAAAEQVAAEQAAAEQVAAEQAAAEQAAAEQAAAEQAAAEQVAAEQAAAEQTAAEQAAAEQAAAEQAAAEQAAAEQAAAEQAAAEQAAAEQAAAEQVAAEQAAAEQAAAEQATAEITPNDADRKYLQDILEGKTTLEDMDAIESKLSDIWSRTEGTELESLVKEVSTYISNYALNSYNETVA